MKKRKVLAVLLCAAMTAALAVGCGGSKGSDSSDKSSDSSSSSDDVITVGFSQVGAESDWRTANTESMKSTFSEDNGYELIFDDAQQKQENQLTAIRNFIQQEVDYIVLAPVTETGWDTVLQEAQDAGIPVIIADREIEASDDLYDAWVGTNTTNEGITAGNWLAEYLGDKDANILVIEGSVGASAALGRTEGFNQVAGEHDNWKILDSQSGDFTQAGGQEVMESFIKSYEGQFNVVVCQNDNEAYGAMDAMDAAGITYGVDGDVTLISFDATHDGLQYTLDGKINCDVECNPIQAEVVKGVIEKMQAGEEFEKTTLVEDQAFVAPGIESEYATTMTDEVLAGRAY